MTRTFARALNYQRARGSIGTHPGTPSNSRPASAPESFQNSTAPGETFRAFLRRATSAGPAPADPIVGEAGPTSYLSSPAEKNRARRRGGGTRRLIRFRLINQGRGSGPPPAFRLKSKGPSCRALITKTNEAGRRGWRKSPELARVSAFGNFKKAINQRRAAHNFLFGRRRDCRR